jgi:hypothetical protein
MSNNKIMSVFRRTQKDVLLFGVDDDSKVAQVSATNVASGVMVSDFRNAVVTLGTGGSPDFTVKFKGSTGETRADFTAAASETNQWDYVDVVDLEDGSSIDGDTGIAFSGTEVRNIEVNINTLDWFAIELTPWVDGTCTAKMTVTTNL